MLAGLDGAHSPHPRPIAIYRISRSSHTSTTAHRNSRPQVSEERVADSERVNDNMMEMINKLRRGCQSVVL